MINEERENILEILLDEDNRDPIVLYDETGKKTTFEQVAVIPYDRKIYCVLKPLDYIKGIADDEAIVFYIDWNDDGEPVLALETDELKAISVFEEYYDLIEKSKRSV